MLETVGVEAAVHRQSSDGMIHRNPSNQRTMRDKSGSTSSFDETVDKRLGRVADKSGEVRTQHEEIPRVARKTIRQAISEVLIASGEPMTSRDIYEAIAQNGLYDFKAKDPASSVRDELRRHCVNVRGTPEAGVKYFRMTDEGSFYLLPSPEDLLKAPDMERIDVFVPSWEGGATKSGYKVGDYIIWPHPHTDGVWLARKGGPVVPGKLGRFTSAEAAISWAHQEIEETDRTGANPVSPTDL